MEKKFKRTTVTSALPYANGPVHIGHLAGVYVPADIYVRYLRLKKEDVVFIGGSDEHGVPITIRAKKEGITPQDVVDRYHTLIKKSFEEFGISFDVYSRTTSKTHHDTASEFFRKLYDKGEFIEKTSMQYYDEEAKTFLADRYITGGAILKNLIHGGYTGELRAVNPKETEVQGVQAYADVKDIPDTDLAILAIPAVLCPDAVELLASEKRVRAFIILSAGFGEETHEGALLEDRILETANRYGASLIGPNCIGLMNTWHHSVFSQPIPNLHPQGVDLISSSGATAVFILESAVTKGLQFNSVWSVGNAKQIGVEDVLQYMDEHFDSEKDSKIKLLYIESISDPDRLLFHASSLIKKGCKIAAIKSGSSESGSRAASSHTGAIASSDSAVEALFRKAGIVRCYSREELTTVGCIFTLPELKGKNFAIITHAGGPGVMLTDALSKGGLNVPKLEGELAEELKSKLFPGAAVGNPIDILATGTCVHYPFGRIW
jgi:acyl-CoA synthetase (NDP forming)